MNSKLENTLNIDNVIKILEVRFTDLDYNLITIQSYPDISSPIDQYNVHFSFPKMHSKSGHDCITIKPKHMQKKNSLFCEYNYKEFSARSREKIGMVEFSFHFRLLRFEFNFIVIIILFLFYFGFSFSIIFKSFRAI